MPTYKYLTDRATDGAIMGYNASDKIGFYGATPVAQQAGASQAAVATTAITTAATTTTPYGYATSTQADNLTTVVAALVVGFNQIRQDLIDLGFIKGAA